MTHHPDLSPYNPSLPEIVADGLYHATFAPTYRRTRIGWLGAGHDYPVGPSPDGFRTRLLDIVRRQTVNATRGFHVCELCPRGRSRASMLAVEHNGDTVHLGNSEIRVPGAPGEVFAAPTLIAHYVAVHDYLPPAPFVDAVLHCPDGWLSGPDAPGVPTDATKHDFRPHGATPDTW
ncbi:hypothetical protein ACGFX4_34990 [Kitasatospora sp. NPDC048365]|uniref:DUF7919 family protein n=1 Tax=Kitasatospora sp. NPDC048365 TaxID=3364050 RepID=UPI00371E2868